MRDQRIAIIGGTGEFGQHMARLLEEGNEIVITGSTLEKAERIAQENGWMAEPSGKAVSSADVVVFSVPIHVTETVIENLAPEIDPETLVCDVTSVKKGPCEAMEGCSDEVLGMHPMFGPSVDPEGQNVILCPIKGKKWTEMEEFWMEQGADIKVTEPEFHDRAVSVVQALTHYTEMVFAKAVSESSIPEESLEDFATPHFKMLKEFSARTLNGDPELYGSIQDSSEVNSEMREKLRESATDVESMIERGKLEELFEQMQEFYSTDSAVKFTDRVIEQLETE